MSFIFVCVFISGLSIPLVHFNPALQVIIGQTADSLKTQHTRALDLIKQRPELRQYLASNATYTRLVSAGVMDTSDPHLMQNQRPQFPFSVIRDDVGIDNAVYQIIGNAARLSAVPIPLYPIVANDDGWDDPSLLLHTILINGQHQIDGTVASRLVSDLSAVDGSLQSAVDWAMGLTMWGLLFIGMFSLALLIMYIRRAANQIRAELLVVPKWLLTRSRSQLDDLRWAAQQRLVRSLPISPISTKQLVLQRPPRGRTYSADSADSRPENRDDIPDFGDSRDLTAPPGPRGGHMLITSPHSIVQEFALSPQARARSPYNGFALNLRGVGPMPSASQQIASPKQHTWRLRANTDGRRGGLQGPGLGLSFGLSRSRSMRSLPTDVLTAIKDDSRVASLRSLTNSVFGIEEGQHPTTDTEGPSIVTANAFNPLDDVERNTGGDGMQYRKQTSHATGGGGLMARSRWGKRVTGVPTPKARAAKSSKSWWGFRGITSGNCTARSLAGGVTETSPPREGFQRSVRRTWRQARFACILAWPVLVFPLILGVWGWLVTAELGDMTFTAKLMVRVT